MTTWRNLGSFQLTNDWQFTPLTEGVFFRITHTASTSTTPRGIIAQSLDVMSNAVPFSRQKLIYRGEPEGVVIERPTPMGARKIALKRVDGSNSPWTVQIEELEGLRLVNLPISTSDVTGLDDALSQINSNIAIGPNPPSNPGVGLKWREIDSSGNLIQEWIWNGLRWRSPILSASNSTISNGSTYWHFPLRNDVDYFVREFNLWLLATSAMDASKFVSTSLRTSSNSSDSIISSFPNPVIPINESRSFFSYINQEVVTSPIQSQSFKVNFARNGNISFVAGTEIKYQLQRKN